MEFTDSYDVSGKNAVVTGGGSGINLAFVELLLSRGCSVLVGDLALNAKAEAVAKEYPYPAPTEEAGQRRRTRQSLSFHKTDGTSWKQLSSLWSRALEIFDGQVDIVVPGAGIYEPPTSSFWRPPPPSSSGQAYASSSSSSDTPADAELGAYATMSINLIHPIRMAQLAIGHWTTNTTSSGGSGGSGGGKGKGNLLFVSSLAGHIAGIGTPLYYSSKAGLHNFVRSIAAGGHMKDKLGIRVLCIAPGIARTPIWEQVHTKSQLPESTHVLSGELVAQKMLDMLVDTAQYGRGEIIEYCEVGTAEQPRQSSREVPSTALYPADPIAGLAGVQAQDENILRMLESEGLKVPL
ncbi:NAD(P)-binding protein [Xylariaceae sp. FL0594]|nr:NAD(P)-binding protein [Xylariaceae sp. FL0594]